MRFRFRSAAIGGRRLQTLREKDITLKIEFDLLQNALDSLHRAIELIAWESEPNDAKRLKQAILAVAHGLELLLKERLRQVHPAFIWENIDKFPRLDARTVTVDSALSRLTNIGGLEFDEIDAKLIRELRDTRNAIEHFVWSTSKKEAEKLVGQALGFALHFAHDELSPEFFFGYGTRKDDTLVSLLHANEHFADAFHHRFNRAQSSHDKARCHFCRAVVTRRDTEPCKFCGEWNRSQEAKDDLPF